MISYNIIKSKNYAFIEIKGQPVLSEFIEASLKFVREPDYSPDLHRLCDFSQANMERISIDQFLEYAEFAKKNVRLHRGTRVALVAPDNDNASIYHSFAEQVDSGVFRVFIDPAAAVEWIKSEPEQTAPQGNDPIERLKRLG